MQENDKKMAQYSKNIIFFDTEFTTLDIKKGQLLSMGLVKISGEELYFEFDYDKTQFIDPWVKENVLPSLHQKPTSRYEAYAKIVEFIGENTTENQKPFLMSYVNQFDAMYWYELFGSAKEHPAYWIPLDFASILFAYGESPNSLGKHTFYTALGLTKNDEAEHDALYDAKMLREIFLRFMASKKSLSSL
jgi:DNA polymerase III epsilon subunit-like protein